MKNLLFTTLFFVVSYIASAQPLNIIQQDYSKALQIAQQEDKLILIDFYTDWCGPCKKLDKLVFQNDSIQQILSTQFVLLKYDAEKDKTFHLSKKHHVSSYPTTIVLNKNGYVLNRKYGFPGETFEHMSQQVLAFTAEAVELDRTNQILKGYTNEVDLSSYPRFYIDFINRDDLKVTKDQAFIDYWSSIEDRTSEGYFSTLMYFGGSAPAFVADTSLRYKDAYLDLYGKTDTETLFFFLASGKFDAAIANKSQAEFDAALVYAEQALSKKWIADILPFFKMDMLKAQNKWTELFATYEQQKDNGELSNGYINHISWDVYKNCDDQAVIATCLDWMQEVTKQEPTYAYLDTYAFLAYKAGLKKEAKRIAALAIAAGKKEEVATDSMEELMAKL
ncbi:MAG: thioredoxin family protein [Bacteroidota bacterium]